MNENVIFTIKSDSLSRKQIVYGHSWNTLESVFNSQKCWYTSGKYTVTNTVTGEQSIFIR